MKKESLICFRASKNLHETLLQVAKEGQRSLSSVIQIALVQYLKERKAFHGVEKEKRQHLRKALSIPAVIHKQEPEQMDVGAITDISLCGVRVVLLKDSSHKTIIDSKCDRFEIVFTLPTINLPIKLTCEPKRMVDSPDSIHIGASFVDANFQSYKALQSYLM